MAWAAQSEIWRPFFGKKRTFVPQTWEFVNKKKKKITKNYSFHPSEQLPTILFYCPRFPNEPKTYNCSFFLPFLLKWMHLIIIYLVSPSVHTQLQLTQCFIFVLPFYCYIFIALYAKLSFQFLKAIHLCIYILLFCAMWNGPRPRETE